MKSTNRWLTIVLIIIVIIQLIAIIMLCFLFSHRSVKKTIDFQSYNFEDPRETVYYQDYTPPEGGFIQDYETAAYVGGSIIDGVCLADRDNELGVLKGAFGVYVDYNQTLDIWRVSKGYLNHRGGVVYLDGDTGAVIYFHFQK